jgi:hypothetical protein
MDDQALEDSRMPIGDHLLDDADPVAVRVVDGGALPHGYECDFRSEVSHEIRVGRVAAAVLAASCHAYRRCRARRRREVLCLGGALIDALTTMRAARRIEGKSPRAADRCMHRAGAARLHGAHHCPGAGRSCARFAKLGKER